MHLLLFFVLAALADWLTCKWHSARERKDPVYAAGVSMLLEALSWAPIWFAITQEDVSIAFMSVLGSGLGTWLGLRHQQHNRCL